MKSRLGSFDFCVVSYGHSMLQFCNNWTVLFQTDIPNVFLRMDQFLNIASFFFLLCSVNVGGWNYGTGRSCRVALSTRIFNSIKDSSNVNEQSLSLFTMPFNELVDKIGGAGRAKSVWSLLKKGEHPLFETSDEILSSRAKKILRNAIGPNPIIKTKIIQETASDCGTLKFLQKLSDNLSIESVLIPAHKYDRTTLCISTQVGCDRGCAFCATGKMGLIRNLTADEILSQVYHGLNIVSRKEMPPMSNIVFMGMGDAGRNLDEVSKAVDAITDRDRFCFAQSKVTISTVGPSPETFESLAVMPATIAWSLHASDDGLRKLLVPSTKHTTVQLRDGLAKALLLRPSLRTRTIMIAITLLENINDTPEDALHLANFIRPLLEVAPKIALDLIPYNDIGISAFKRPSNDRICNFQKVLREEGYFCSVRVTRGDEESSACGMLSTKRANSSVSHEVRV